MDRSPPCHNTSRAKTRRLACASALVGLALAGVVGLGLSQSRVYAQLKHDASQPVLGRAPASFADIVDRVKPAVASIYVTNGGQPKTAQLPKGSPKSAP